MSAHLERVARARGIRLLVQFGSTVTGRTHQKSDVDVAVLLERPSQTLDERAALVHDLERLFPDRELDLAVLNYADPLFLRQVMETARLRYGTEEDLRRRFVADAVRGAAGRVDRDLVIRKLAMILDDLRAVGPFAAKPLDDYLAGAIDEVVTERYLERMIGRMTDVNYHLITDAGHAPPRDYYESFTNLAKIDVLPAAFASRLAACAGLRNRIVHEYDDIDPRRVYEGLQAAVRDIPEYLRHVHAYVERTGHG